MSMKCLVTGAAGFVASHLCERLIADGHTVIGLDDLSTGRMENLESLKDESRFSFRRFDVTEDEWHNDADYIFHLAGKADVVPSIETPYFYHDVNVLGTLNMLESARRCPSLKKFVYAASSSCYGIPESFPTKESSELQPQYPYALTKMIGEQYVMHWNRVYKLPAVSLRLFNIYGPRARTSGAYGAVFGTFLSQLANGAPLTIVGDGEQKRDFTFVTDAVDAFVKAAEGTCDGWIFNIGSGRPRSVNELKDLLGATKVEYIPDRPGEPRCTWADATWASQVLKWYPKVSFEEGVSRMKYHIGEFKDAPVWTRESIAVATKSWFKYLGETNNGAQRNY
jgi:UDP-glucose 4-epimerase